MFLPPLLRVRRNILPGSHPPSEGHRVRPIHRKTFLAERSYQTRRPKGPSPLLGGILCSPSFLGFPPRTFINEPCNSSSFDVFLFLRPVVSFLPFFGRLSSVCCPVTPQTMSFCSSKAKVVFPLANPFLFRWSYRGLATEDLGPQFSVGRWNKWTLVLSYSATAAPVPLCFLADVTVD